MTDRMTAEQYQHYAKTGKLPGAEPTVKRSKYGNVKKIVDGLKFDSTREANRFTELMLKHKAGLISKPILQYEFKLVGCSYVCDFLYLDYEKKDFVVEDVKSEATRKISTYIIKKKQMKEIYNITILES
jgi:hypothetical protein